MPAPFDGRRELHRDSYRYPRRRVDWEAEGGYPSFPRVPWEEVWPEIIEEWEPGWHALICGRSGFGKTHAALQLLDGRASEPEEGGRAASVCILENKARDKILRGLGWPIIDRWPPTFSQREQRRIILWPKYLKASENAAHMKPVFMEALDEMMNEGGWTVYIDETAYFVENLGLRSTLDEFWNGGRSSEITLIAGSQRPVWVNRSMVSQAQWAFVFFIGDEDDRQRLGQILGSRRRFPPVIARLKRHECLAIRTDTGRGVITKLPAQLPVLEKGHPDLLSHRPQGSLLHGRVGRLQLPRRRP